MQSRKYSYYFHKIKVGFRLRCPHCELGKMFKGLFQIEETCPYCGVRFERSSGDGIGGVYINVAIAELTSVGGFFLMDALFHPSLVFQLVFWGAYILLFTVFFFRHGKGLWVGVNYLLGGVYADPDYMREYIAPRQPVPKTKSKQENE